MAEQPGPSTEQKNKGVAEQRAPSAKQHLRMVPMIAGPALISEEKKKKKQNKRMEQRIKRLRSLGHTINYVSAHEEFYPAAPIVFTEQDLQVVRLSHQDLLVVKLQVDKTILGRVLINDGSSVEVFFWDAF